MSEDPVALKHSLLRLLAVADSHSLDVHRAVELFSKEHWGLHRWRLNRLLGNLEQEGNLLPALEKTRCCVGDQTMLALRLGNATGTLPKAWDELKQWERPIHTETTKVWRGSKFYWATVALAMSLVAMLFAWQVAPVLQRTTDEFAFDFEESILVKHLDKFIFVVLAGLISFVILWLLWRVSIIHTKSWLHQFAARLGRERTNREIGIWRLLAMNLDSGLSVKSSIDHLAHLHEDARMRQKLSIASESILKGLDEWQSLVNAKLLHPIEHNAITATNNPEVQAWTLRHLALRRRENLHFDALRRNMWTEPVITLLFGLFVLMIAFAVFSSLTQIILSLAERHG